MMRRPIWMPEQAAHNARGLVTLALAACEQRDDVHPGVRPHLLAAKAQLDAACSLLAVTLDRLDAVKYDG